MTKVFAVDHPELPPYEMPRRFRQDIAYFKTPAGAHGAPQLPEGEYWVRLEEARLWLEEGVLDVVSPLDSNNKTEIELSDEQEDWLAWMVEHDVQHIRLE